MVTRDLIQHLEDDNMGRRGKLKAIVTIVLAIGLTSVLVGDSAGSMPGMDTDLGDSDASFWGEDADSNTQGSPDGQFMANMASVRTPYYFRPIELGAPVIGFLAPGALTSSDETAEIVVTGPAFPRVLINNVGTFTHNVNLNSGDFPLTIHGVEHVSIWASSSNEDVRDASFKVTLLRNDVSVWSMSTNIADLDNNPKELKVSDIPSFEEPLICQAYDNLEVKLQYTAASRFGTGPAPDCVFYSNSLECPSRVELDAVPMDVEVTVPKVGPDRIEVRGKVMDTSEENSEALKFDLKISSSSKGPVNDDTIELIVIDDAWGELLIDWIWYYRQADPIDNIYEFQVSASYGVGGIYYTNSIFLGLAFDENGDAHIATEIDRDGDGYYDDIDDFPDDATEWVDTDGDGHGDNSDKFPLDVNEWTDTDGDDHGDNGDAFPDNPVEWLDTDGDGHGDNGDVFADDPLEWADTDGDGTGDNGDAFPDDPLEWVDTDGDGHGDNSDVFPNDPLEWLDTDGDTHGNNGDAFPYDPSEWLDGDKDGYGDNSDIFPQDPLEWIDADGDGYGDNGDAFLDNPFEWLDTDGDTHGDNGDVFPNDPLEWLDADDDGHGDNSDAFPNDKDEWLDTDGDGSGDNGDAFPDDAAASVDTDGDGYPDEWNTGKSKADSTTELKIDQFPSDPEKWKKKDDASSTPSLGPVWAICAIVFAIMVNAVLLRRKPE